MKIILHENYMRASALLAVMWRQRMVLNALISNVQRDVSAHAIRRDEQ